jgi:hypothetical protein
LLIGFCHFPEKNMLKINNFWLTLMGKMQWDFFFGTEEVQNKKFKQVQIQVFQV